MAHKRDIEGVAFLERLQRDAGIAFATGDPAKTDEDYLDLARHLIRSGAREADEAAFAARLRRDNEVPEPARWSALERPDHRLRLWRAELAVERGMEALAVVLPSPLPAVGTLPTWQLNALALAAPSPCGYVIALESGLFSFTAGWSAIHAACVLGVENGWLLDRFIDICFCQIILGTAAYRDLRPMGHPAVEDLGERVAPVFEAFMLGHEYAHVALGHRPVDLDAPGVRPDLQAFTQDEELAADALSLRAIVKAFPDPLHGYVTVGGLLAALQLMERGYALLAGDPSLVPPGSTHPPALLRRRAVLELAPELLGGDALVAAIATLRIIEEQTSGMWMPLEKGFWRGRDGMPRGWAPATPEEKSAALMAFKWICLGPPASLR